MDINLDTDRKSARAELEALERQKERRDAEPLLLCKLITRWPVRSFTLALLGHIAMIGLSGILYLTGYDILPLFLDDVPMRLENEPWDARLFAWNDRNKYVAHYTRGGAGSGFRTSDSWYSALDLFYQNTEGGNVFTKEALVKIKQIENHLVELNNFDKFCKLNVQTKTCEKPMSVLRYFDGTFAAIHPVFNDSDFNNIKAVLFEAYTNPATRDNFRYFLAKTFNASEKEVTSPLTRSLISFGIPHEQFNLADYKAEIEKFSGENVYPILKQYETISEFELSYRSEALWMFNARNQAMEDVLWAGASMGFIFLVILFHTRSLWIAGLSIFSIFASFFTGNLIYNLVFQFKYIGYFHILALFIILGIGADDVFVFYDIWRNTGFEEYKSIAHRLSDCYKRSVLSMLFTSLTTAVAFLCSAISPLLATRSFGLFSALVIIVNFISVVIYFPTVVIVYHIYFENVTWPCFYPCQNRNAKSPPCKSREWVNSRTSPDGESDPESRASEEDVNLGQINPVYQADDVESQGRHWSSFFNDLFPQSERPTPHQDNESSKRTKVLSAHNLNNNDDESSRTPVKQSDSPNEHIRRQKSNENRTFDKKGSEQKNKKKSLFVLFFRNYYFRFVTNRYARWLIVVVLVGMIVFFIYFASKIEPDNELFNVLPDDHPFTKAYKFKLYGFVENFGQANALLVVHFLFGVKPNDISACHFSDPVCTGQQEWDPDFNPNTEDAQIALMNLCKTLRTLPEQKADVLRIQKHPVTGKYNVKCFMEDLQAFLMEESDLTGTNWSLPFTKEKVIRFAEARPQFYNASVLRGDFNNNLQIPISYWLNNRYSGSYTDDFYKYDSLIGEETGVFSTGVNTNPDILYGNNLKFVAVSVGTTIPAMLLGYREGEGIMENWEELLNKLIEKMPKELKTGFQTSSHERWVWITRQRLLVENAVYGIAIGLSLALVILIAATGNLITGLLATLSLCCCTACVIGVIVLGGWKLGLIEAMNMCMVVGLSVDYVVHLAEGYTLSLHYDRLSRVRDMLDLMAVSVFFGAFTTLGASLFMFFTVLSFFSQFGIFLFSTIGFSLLFSMGLFTTLLGILGPERDTGNVVAICRYICSFETRSHRRQRRKRNI